MQVKRKSTYTLKVSSAEMAALVMLAYAAKDFTHGLGAIGGSLEHLGEAIKDIDPFVLDHVHDVLSDFGLELGID